MRRVVLRQVDRGAWAALAALLVEHGLRRQLYGGRTDVSPAAAARRWCASPQPGTWRWAVWDAEQDQVRGGIAIVQGALSFFIDPVHQGQGLCGGALHALRARLQQPGAPLPWSQLTAHTLRDNTAARRVLVAAGLRETGLCPQPIGLPTLVCYAAPAAPAALHREDDDDGTQPGRQADLRSQSAQRDAVDHLQPEG